MKTVSLENTISNWADSAQQLLTWPMMEPICRPRQSSTKDPSWAQLIEHVSYITSIRKWSSILCPCIWHGQLAAHLYLQLAPSYRLSVSRIANTWPEEELVVSVTTTFHSAISHHGSPNRSLLNFTFTKVFVTRLTVYVFISCSWLLLQYCTCLKAVGSSVLMLLLNTLTRSIAMQFG